MLLVLRLASGDAVGEETGFDALGVMSDIYSRINNRRYINSGAITVADSRRISFGGHHGDC
jgi:hypothetical protein